MVLPRVERGCQLGVVPARGEYRASMFVVGGGRPGLGLRVSRLLEGAVSARLIRVSEPPGRRGA